MGNSGVIYRERLASKKRLLSLILISRWRRREKSHKRLKNTVRVRYRVRVGAREKYV
jgi:hypothetical protein